MRCDLRLPTLILVVLLAGCADSGPSSLELAKKAAEEQAAKDKADRDQARREKERLAEDRLREELNKDFELLLGHWDHCGGKGPDGKSLPSLHLEIAPNATARFAVVAGSVHSLNECPIHLTGEGEKRFISPDEGATYLKSNALAYRLDGDQLTLTGTANDVLLKEIDLSGAWRRTNWTKRTEAEIADVLKKLDANIVYDENNPANPIVKVSFNFQAPVHNAHLRIFAGLKRLQDLDLSNTTSLSDPGLRYLADLKQLKQLTLTSLPVSTEAVQELKKELPNCNIAH